MGEKIKYKKIFLLFNREDAGYENLQEPSGYLKVEVRDGQGKLTALVQNLKEQNSKANYALYLVKHDDKKTHHVFVGYLPLCKNKGELQWDFNAYDVGKTGIHIDEIKAAVILCEYTESKKYEIICPLAAYKDKKINWRDSFREALRQKGSQPDSDKRVLEESEITSKYIDTLESKYETPRETISTEISQERLEPKQEESYVESIESPQTEIDVCLDDSNASCMESQIDTRADTEEVNVEFEVAKKEETENIFRNDKIKAERNESVSDMGKNGGISNLEVNTAEQEEIQNTNYKPEDSSDFENIPFTEFNDSMKYIDKDLPEETDNITQIGNNEFKCSNEKPCMRQTGGENNYSFCQECQKQHSMKETSKAVIFDAGEMDKFKANMDKYFEVFDPFRSKRRDYKWWKINSPAHLNNILFQSNVKTPLFFNPKVLMAHFKYRHLILGIYSDRARRRDYIVCGIPGVHNIDDKPFGDMCKWVQVEGSKPKYGAFGYWLVFIEPGSGKLLSIN